MWLSVFSHLASGPRPHVHVRRVQPRVSSITDCGNTLTRRITQHPENYKSRAGPICGGISMGIDFRY
jgi:hypothetical protein